RSHYGVRPRADRRACGRRRASPRSDGPRRDTRSDRRQNAEEVRTRSYGSANGTITHDFFMPATLFVVATPIGNLEDITARALRTLREVALIAAEDTRRTAHLLARYAISTPTTSLHEHNEKKKAAALIAQIGRAHV